MLRQPRRQASPACAPPLSPLALRLGVLCRVDYPERLRTGARAFQPLPGLSRALSPCLPPMPFFGGVGPGVLNNTPGLGGLGLFGALGIFGPRRPSADPLRSQYPVRLWLYYRNRCKFVAVVVYRPVYVRGVVMVRGPRDGGDARWGPPCKSVRDLPSGAPISLRLRKQLLWH